MLSATIFTCALELDTRSCQISCINEFETTFEVDLSKTGY